MKPTKEVKKTGFLEMFFNYLGYYKPEVKKLRKPRTPRAKKADNLSLNNELSADMETLSP